MKNKTDESSMETPKIVIPSRAPLDELSTIILDNPVGAGNAPAGFNPEYSAKVQKNATSLTYQFN